MSEPKHYETAAADRIPLTHKVIYGLGAFVNNTLADAIGRPPSLAEGKTDVPSHLIIDRTGEVTARSAALRSSFRNPSLGLGTSI